MDSESIIMILPLIIAPDPIYKLTCQPVAAVTDEIRKKLADMVETMHAHHAIGIGAPMVGLTERLVVVDLEDENGTRHFLQMANPTIINRSAEMRTITEASITFWGVSAEVTRPQEIEVSYLDETGATKNIKAAGILAACLQHEMDYLDGRNFLDYLPPVKRDMLKRKMEKFKRSGHPPHAHSHFCQH